MPPVHGLQAPAMPPAMAPGPSFAVAEQLAAPAEPRAAHPPPPWQLLFSDEFDAAALDESKWTFQIGDGAHYDVKGWGNEELVRSRGRCLLPALNCRGQAARLPACHTSQPTDCSLGPPVTALPVTHPVQEYYTSSRDNVRLEGSMLVLQAQQSDPANPYSTTSGRIHTLDKFSVAPSAEFPTIRIEARMKLPRGEYQSTSQLHVC
jgi:hypothetical protein